ncbi:hypothetical protein L195_g019879 [Trifolium pratense]|uniref:Uncharacterized protein n=1 Tax=Trifolium pratense TaxID=57577 RepID=A0A2K3N0W0_TRIPR|nr:hypothetical protein L195_g019879 [Trifolium pratense]
MVQKLELVVFKSSFYEKNEVRLLNGQKLFEGSHCSRVAKPLNIPGEEFHGRGLACIEQCRPSSFPPFFVCFLGLFDPAESTFCWSFQLHRFLTGPPSAEGGLLQLIF